MPFNDPYAKRTGNVRIDTGIHAGGVRIDDACRIDGMVAGDITVGAGGFLILKGMCKGNVIVEPGGKTQIDGILAGKIINADAANG